MNILKVMEHPKELKGATICLDMRNWLMKGQILFNPTFAKEQTLAGKKQRDLKLSI